VRLAVALFGELEARGIAGPPVVLTQAATLARYNKLSRLNAIRAGAAGVDDGLAPSFGRAVVNRQAKMIRGSDSGSGRCGADRVRRNAVSGTGHVCAPAVWGRLRPTSRSESAGRGARRAGVDGR